VSYDPKGFLQRRQGLLTLRWTRRLPWEQLVQSGCKAQGREKRFQVLTVANMKIYALCHLSHVVSWALYDVSEVVDDGSSKRLLKCQSIFKRLHRATTRRTLTFIQVNSVVMLTSQSVKWTKLNT
jgi:hypothetical protein